MSAAAWNFLSKFEVGYLTFPFNLCSTALFFYLRGSVVRRLGDAQEALEGQDFIHGNSTSADEGVDWSKVALGSLLSVGQIYGIDSAAASAVILAASALANPIILFTYAFGTVGNTALSAALLPPGAARSEAYAGLWGYNGALAATAVGCVFSYFTPSSVLLAAVAVTSGVFTQYWLRWAGSTHGQEWGGGGGRGEA